MPLSRPVSRRASLTAIVGACAAVTAPGLLLGRPAVTRSLREPAQRPWLAQASELKPGTALTTAALQVALPGLPQQTLAAYNAAIPGPLITLRRGQAFRQKIQNRLDDETVVHWHGLSAPSAMDGQPRYPIAPGEDTEIAFEVQERAGLYWYHPHPHGKTAQQAWQGMAGLIVVGDEEEDALNLPAGEQELLLMLRDGQLGSERQWLYPNALEGSQGDFPLINGVPWPRTTLPNQWVRLRILNASNARVFDLRCDVPMVLIGNDGGLLEAPATVSAIEMAPAERVDLLLDLRGQAVGEQIALHCASAGWKLLDIEVTQAANPTKNKGWEPPARLSHIEGLGHSGEEPDRAFVFQDNTLINGLPHDMDRTDFVVPLGKVERWRFVAIGATPHPIHTHGAHFQVVGGTAADGEPRRIAPWECGWKDTVLVRPNEGVDVLVRFAAYEGNYLLHCHNLEHEDGGMMANFIVAKNIEMAERLIEAERLFGRDPMCQPWA